MGAHGMTLVEEGHFVELFIPVNQSTALTSEVFSMKNWAHATILVHGGSGSATTIALYECDDFTPSNRTAIGFNYAKEDTAEGDTLTALAVAGTGGVAVGTNTGVFVIIELDATQLSDGYPCVQITSTSAAKYISATAILTGGRYQESEGATVES